MSQYQGPRGPSSGGARDHSTQCNLLSVSSDRSGQGYQSNNNAFQPNQGQAQPKTRPGQDNDVNVESDKGDTVRNDSHNEDNYDSYSHKERGQGEQHAWGTGVIQSYKNQCVTCEYHGNDVKINSLKSSYVEDNVTNVNNIHPMINEVE